MAKRSLSPSAPVGDTLPLLGLLLSHCPAVGPRRPPGRWGVSGLSWWVSWGRPISPMRLDVGGAGPNDRRSGSIQGRKRQPAPIRRECNNTRRKSIIGLHYYAQVKCGPGVNNAQSESCINIHKYIVRNNLLSITCFWVTGIPGRVMPGAGPAVLLPWVARFPPCRERPNQPRAGCRSVAPPPPDAWVAAAYTAGWH